MVAQIGAGLVKSDRLLVYYIYYNLALARASVGGKQANHLEADLD